jgi:hypothetical protein
MVSRLQLGLTAVLIMLACSLHAQIRLGFSNLNGFPDVITEGQAYNLSGWIVNHGSSGGNGVIDIMLKADSVGTVVVSNNFNIANSLQPGDSVYWSKSNFIFPQGAFRLGNNDVIIWPTAPSSSTGAEVDSLTKPVYYTDASALRLREADFVPFQSTGFELETTYELSATIKNLSSNPTSNTLRLFAELPGFRSRVVDSKALSLQLNDETVFTVPDFSVWETFDLHSSDTVGYNLSTVRFYALEVGSNCGPLNFVDVAIDEMGAVTSTGSNLANGLSIFPNPAKDFVTVQFPAAWIGCELQLYDITGRAVYAKTMNDHQLNLQGLKQGCYWMVLRNADQVMQQRIVKL